MEDNRPINKDDILEYAAVHGDESAYGLLLLVGPDGFDGTWDEYCSLEEQLNG